MVQKKYRLPGIAIALVAVAVGVLLGIYVFPARGFERAAYVGGETMTSSGLFRGASTIIIFGSGTFDKQNARVTGSWVIGEEPINVTANQKEWGTWKSTSIVSYTLFGSMSSRNDEAGMLVVKAAFVSTNGTSVAQDVSVTIVCAMVPDSQLPSYVLRTPGGDYVTLIGGGMNFDNPLFGFNHFTSPQS